MKMNEAVAGRRPPSLTRPVFTCYAALLLLLACSAQAASTLEKVAQSGVLTIGYQDAPPFSFQDDAKQPIGYSIDLCMKIVEAIKRETKRPDLTVKYVQVDATTNLAAIADGEVDMECANTANTLDKRKKVAFTIPTFISATRLMTKRSADVNSVFDLSRSKLTVLVIKGSRGEKTYEGMKADRILKGKSLVVGDYKAALAALESDKADAFIMDEVSLYSMRAATKTPDNYVITRHAMSIDSMAFMFRKGDPAFKKLVDSEVTRIIAQGEINAVYKKWFESPIPPNQVNLKLPMPYMMRDSFRTPTDWVPE